MDNNTKIICTCNVKLRFAQDSCSRRFDSYFNFCEDKKKITLTSVKLIKQNT